MKVKVRQSNIELLRIFAIFLVLVCHAVGKVQGLPSAEVIQTSAISSYLELLLMSIAIGGVDIFVLISGWFGIHSTKRGLCKFLFQVLFLLWGIYIFFIAIGETTVTVAGIKLSMGLTGEYWFVMAYLGMYLLSPVLNAFAEKVSKKEFQYVLIAFYIFQCYYSWATAVVDYYNGYSITFFCGLYLTARYLRLYPVRVIDKHSSLIYIVAVLLISVVATLALGKFGNAARMLRYDNPLVILGSLAILISFGKLKIQNKVINWIARSCFAVYIIHFNPYLFKYFVQAERQMIANFCGVTYVLAITMFLVVVFAICVFIDQIRIFFWNLVIKKTNL